MRCCFCGEDIDEGKPVCPWCGRRQDSASVSETGGLFEGVAVVKISWKEEVEQRNQSKLRGLPPSVQVHYIVEYPNTKENAPVYLPTWEEPVCLLRMGIAGWDDLANRDLAMAIEGGKASLSIKTYCYPSYPILQLLLRVDMDGYAEPFYRETLGDISDQDIQGFILDLTRMKVWKLVLLRHDAVKERKEISALIRITEEQAGRIVREARSAVACYRGIPAEARDFDRGADQFMEDAPPIEGIDI